MKDADDYAAELREIASRLPSGGDAAKVLAKAADRLDKPTVKRQNRLWEEAIEEFAADHELSRAEAICQLLENWVDGEPDLKATLQADRQDD